MTLESKLKEILELASMANGGEWVHSQLAIFDTNDKLIAAAQDSDDAKFIAASRTLVPQLIKALQTAIEQREICKINYEAVSIAFRGYVDANTKDFDSELLKILEGK